MLSAWRAGVTLRSIADVLGLSHATVRIRIHELERQESRQAA
jgi:predicted ArsR family transcriptional regulator